MTKVLEPSPFKFVHETVDTLELRSVSQSGYGLLPFFIAETAIVPGKSIVTSEPFNTLLLKNLDRHQTRLIIGVQTRVELFNEQAVASVH